MPAVVDHEQRRQAIAEIVADIIAREGLEAVSIRTVAAAAGFSTTIVTHYFASKHELLRHTHQVAAGHAMTRVHSALARDPCDLQACLEAMLPLNEQALRDWKVYFAFWQVAARNEEFGVQERRSIQHARDLIRLTLEARRDAGLAPEALDTSAAAKRLLTFIQGIALQAIVDRQGWSPARQRGFLRSELLLFEQGV